MGFIGLHGRWIAFIAIIMLVIGGFYLLNAFQAQQAKTQSAQPSRVCGSMKVSKDYTPGILIISMRDDLTTDQYYNIIDQYGLQTKDTLEAISTLIVTVPSGHEVEWLCRLSKDDRFRSVNLDGPPLTTQ